MSPRTSVPWTWGREPLPAKEDPFGSLQREMDRLFEDFSGAFDVAPFGGRIRPSAALSPDIDVAETDKAFEVSVDLPGVEEKDIEVSLSEGALTIKGEKKAEKEEAGRNYHRIERSYGSFRRSIALPAGIDESKAEASFKNGVLSIAVPKTKEAKLAARKIAVKAA